MDSKHDRTTNVDEMLMNVGSLRAPFLKTNKEHIDVRHETTASFKKPTLRPERMVVVSPGRFSGEPTGTGVNLS